MATVHKEASNTYGTLFVAASLMPKRVVLVGFFLHLTINILGLYIFLNNSYVLRDQFSSLMLSSNNVGLQIAFFYNES